MRAALRWAAAAALVGLAGAQDRVRVTFADDRVYTGRLTLDGEGELVLDSDRLGGPAVLDFPAVARIERLDDAPAPDDAGVDTLSLVGRERLAGELLSLDDDTLRFRSRLFGELEVPRALAGDLIPRGGAAEAPADAPADSPERAAGWGGWEGFGDLARVDGLAVALDGRGARLTRAGDLSGHLITVQVAWRGLPEFALELGGATLRTWDGVPVLTAEGPDGLEVAVSPTGLGLDERAVLQLRVHGDEALELEAIEASDGTRLPVGVRVGLVAAPDTLAIEAFGRPMSVGSVDLRDPDEMLGADGLVRFDRPLRGAEALTFDPAARTLTTPLGPAAIDACPGVAFLPDERRDELDMLRVEDGQGLFVARSGEAVAVTQVLFARGAFVLRSPYAEAPVQVPYEELQSIRMPAGRGARGGADYRMSFDGGPEITGGFIGIEPAGDGFRVIRTEPGFKTPVPGGVAGQVWIERTERSLFHASPRRFPHEVLLSDGQTFPANVEEITAEHVVVRTPFSDEPVRLDQGAVSGLLFQRSKVEELLAEITAEPRQKAQDRAGGNLVFVMGGEPPRKSPTLVTAKRLERALLVPRNQKDDPGTHLLLAQNGDLMRCNVVARAGDRLSVDGGAGGAMEIPMDVLAAVIRIAPDAGASGDPREDKIITRRSTGDWTVNLGPRATLVGTLLSTEGGTLRILHPLLGEVAVPRDEFKRLDHGRGFAPRFRALLDWRTQPMPEPSITGG